YNRYVFVPQYTVSTSVYVLQKSDKKEASYMSILTAEQMSELYPYLLQNGLLDDALKDELGTTDYDGSINISVNEYSNILNISVTGSDPQKVKDLLDAVVKVFPDTTSYLVGPTTFEVLTPYDVPTKPSNQASQSELAIIKYCLIRTFIAVFAVIVLLMLYGMTIRTMGSVDEIKRYLNADNLGALPAVRLKRRSNKKLNELIIDNDSVEFGFNESVRTVRTRLERACEKVHAKTLIVTSTVPGEGKTTVSVNLAMALAQKSFKVMLIDGDMRNPSVSGILQLNDNAAGLSEYLEGKAELKDIIYHLPDTSLYVIMAGKPTAKSADFLSSSKMEQMLLELRDYADYILVDTPPIMTLGDSIAVAKYVDGCVYVVRRDYARRSMVMDGFATVSENGCRILGTILNRSEAGSTGYGGGYYRYGKYGYKNKYYKNYIKEANK
ncbi:MAG: polysaccharide biosynthesis tyrosine autokinase, partial [Lachnospiraceae bacterium]|nr:polysaccharide biosynthesis tyrosine autokinase [Lachnospiraceae bacterium]